MGFGEVLRKARTETKLSAAKTAALIGVDPERLRKWEERDAAPKDTGDKKAVSDYFGIDLDNVQTFDLGKFKTRLQERTGASSADAETYLLSAKDEVIAALRQTAQAEREAKLAEREAKEAYKEIARLREVPTGEYVTRERFDLAELRTQVLRSWTVDSLSKLSKVPRKALERELGKRIEDTLQLYMQDTSRVEGTLSMQG